MQLILQSEAAVDLKKTMSTFEDTMETPQINGSVSDIQDDVCAAKKISNESIADSDNNDAQLLDNISVIGKENAIEKCLITNGLVKIHANDQNEEQETNPSKNIEISKENLENVSSEIIQNQVGSTVLNESSNEPTSQLVNNSDVASDNEKNKCDQIQDILLEVNGTARIDVTDDVDKLITSFRVHEKDVNSDSIPLSVEKVPSEVITNPIVIAADNIEPESIKITDVAARKSDIISNELVVKIPEENGAINVSAFSPNSDSDDKDMNLTSQLKQLEEDEEMQEDPSKIRFTKLDDTTEAKTVEDTEKFLLNKTTFILPDIKTGDESIITNDKTKDQEPIEPADPVKINEADAHTNENSNTDFVNETTVNIQRGEDIKMDEPTAANPDLIENKEDTSSLSKEDNSSESIVENHIGTGTTDQGSEKNSNSVQDILSETDSQKKKGERDPTNIMYVNDVNVVEVGAAEQTVAKKNEDTVMDVENITNDKASVNYTNDEKVAHEIENVCIQGTQEVEPLESEKPVPMESEDNLEKPVVEVTKDSASNALDVSILKDLLSHTHNDCVNIEMNIDDNKINPIDEKSSDPTSEKSDNKDIVALRDIDETIDQEVINIDKDEVKDVDKTDVIFNNDSLKDLNVNEKLPTEIIDEEGVKAVENINKGTEDIKSTEPKPIQEKVPDTEFPIVCKLSNTMDILSDEEDDPPPVKPSEENKVSAGSDENKCINIDDDDDLMIIEETNSLHSKDQTKFSEKLNFSENLVETESPPKLENIINPDTGEKEEHPSNGPETLSKVDETDDTVSFEADELQADKTKLEEKVAIEQQPPIIPKTFLKTVTKNLAEMTRSELEDFCVLRLLESVVDKSKLIEIKNKVKTMAQTIEDLDKKATAVTKQNRDLQVVVKSIQENHRQRNSVPIMPMKITRSVGLQVVLKAGDKGNNNAMLKKKLSGPSQPPPVSAPARSASNMPSPKTPKLAANIPVPRLVPATIKSPSAPIAGTAVKGATPPAPRTPHQRLPEKRPHHKVSPGPSVMVDLTEDEPPTKIPTKSPAPPVRLVPAQSLMPKNGPQFITAGNSPRKVYIPISGPGGQPRAGMIKNFVAPRPRAPPSVIRMQHTVRMPQMSNHRHPAPLPDVMKQYQPPGWKALPPSPDLKLSKVDNGIVISWKFEGYKPDQYEEVASFQLYAYQETTAPPNTNLWKKIGDIKALPLPMACTLTQFMSGFKYYFAVRAIDVRSRVGPFSLPGSIMLISK